MSADMTIQSEDGKSGGRYWTTIEGHSAEMTFSRASAKLIIIDHTEVPEALKGKGVGKALAEHAVDAARDGGWKIIPLCPFFKAMTMRHPEWQDVI